MPPKIKTIVSRDGSASSVAESTPQADGKTYIRNPSNPNQILQVQSRQGRHFLCYPVTRKDGATITVDSKNAVYVEESYEGMSEKI